MDKTVKIPRMVTIREAAQATSISEYAIRKMCRDNSIVHIRAGVKYLVNFDRLIETLNGTV